MAVLLVDIMVNDNGTSTVKKFTEEAKKAESSTNSLRKSSDNLGSSFTSLQATIATIGLGALAVETVKTADSMKLLEARINLTSSSLDSYSKIQQDMTRIANENGIAIQSVGNLYSKLATSLKPLGISTQSVMTVTDAFSKSLLISGASTEEASSATLQFAQAMASGRLQGDEFRSMAENSPRFMKAMTESLGKTSSEIRQMAEDGKLTTSVVGGALIDSIAKLREESQNMPMTVGKAFNELKNEATLTVEQFDKLTGVNDSIAKGFQAITEKVVNLREELPKLSAEMTEWEKRNEKGIYVLKQLGGGFIDGASFIGGEVARTWKDFGIIIAETYTGIAEKAGYALGIVNDDILKYNKNLQQTQIELAKTAKAEKDKVQALKDAQADEEAKKQFKNVVTPVTDVKKQVSSALEEYSTYYKTIGDNETYLSIKRQEYAEKYKNLNSQQIDQMINAERSKLNKTDDLNKEWSKRKLDLTYENEIAQSDEMAKPFIQLEKKYKEDLEHFKGNSEAKKLLTENYYTEANRLQKDTIEKFNKKEEERLEKLKSQNDASIQKELKLQEENFRIQQRQIALLDDEADKQIALATLEYQRTEASLAAQLKKDEITPDYYNRMMEAEDRLFAKQKQNWTVIGQLMTNVTGDMESSFGSLMDYSSDRFLKFGKLFESVANDIYNELMRIAVIKPIVSGITTGISGYFSTPTTSSSSSLNYSTSSGGSLTNAYFQAYDGGMIPFASGGYTGNGGKYEPKGVVHGGEYVIPAWMVQKNKPLISSLEATRTKGYADGGSVGGNVSGNVRVEIKNESSQSLEVTSASQTYDSEGAVLSIVINGIQKNKMGIRDMLGGR